MFFVILLLIAMTWFLWNICRNTNDALDKQTAIQYEIVSLEKRVEELLEKLEEEKTSSKKPEAPGLKALAETDLADKQTSINVNTATEDELISLPKVGHALAKRIIDGRPYKDRNDLLEVKGLSEEVIRHFEARITY